MLKTRWLVNSDTISTLYVRFTVRWLAVYRGSWDRFSSWHTYVVCRAVKFKGRNFARGVMSEKYLIWILGLFHKYHNIDMVCFRSLILLFCLWYCDFSFLHQFFQNQKDSAAAPVRKRFQTLLFLYKWDQHNESDNTNEQEWQVFFDCIYRRGVFTQHTPKKL